MPGPGRKRGEECARIGSVDPEPAPARVVEVEEPARDDGARSPARSRPHGSQTPPHDLERERAREGRNEQPGAAGLLPPGRGGEEAVAKLQGLKLTPGEGARTAPAVQPAEVEEP